MFRTIVVGTDGSGTAGTAVAKAVELAKQSGGTLHLVNAYNLPTAAMAVPAAGAAAWTDDAVTGALLKEASEQVVAEAAGQVGDVTLQTHIVTGGAADAIIQVAEQVNADLIVVGSKGMHRRIIGSVPNSVAHNAPCHVLIVKTD